MKFSKFQKDIYVVALQEHIIFYNRKLLNSYYKTKLRTLESLSPQVISTGNIGCITQIANGTNIPILHTVELLDWYTGGPEPKILKGI